METEWEVVKEEGVTDCLFLCPLCPQLYSQAKCLSVHLKKAHQSPTDHVDPFGISMEGSVVRQKQVWKNRHRFVFKCLKCETICPSRYKLSSHVRVQAERKEVTCEKESSDALSLGHSQCLLFLKQRLEDYHQLCHMCGAVFRKKDVFLHHVKTHKEALPAELVCELCPYTTDNVIRLKRHRWKWHSAKPRLRSHICEICGKGFFEKQAMVSHVENTHLKNKTHQCELCFKVFNRRRSFLRHMKNHRSDRPHECLQCGRSFSQAYNLRVHERLHTGEKPYRCQHCDAAFAQKNSLNIHMKKHQNSERYRELDQPSTGNRTDTAFAQKHNLNVHINKLQEKARAGLNSKPDDYSPNQYNPDQYNPDQYNPDQYNPSQYKPDQYNPNRYKPDQYNPDHYKSDQYKPNQYDSDQYKPGQGDRGQYKPDQNDPNQYVPDRYGHEDQSFAQENMFSVQAGRCRAVEGSAAGEKLFSGSCQETAGSSAARHKLFADNERGGDLVLKNSPPYVSPGSERLSGQAV